jgi:hypothetical protein
MLIASDKRMIVSDQLRGSKRMERSWSVLRYNIVQELSWGTEEYHEESINQDFWP